MKKKLPIIFFLLLAISTSLILVIYEGKKKRVTQTQENLVLKSEKFNVNNLQNSLLTALQEREKIERESALLALKLVELKHQEALNKTKIIEGDWVKTGSLAKESILRLLSNLEKRRIQALLKQIELEQQILMLGNKIQIEDYASRNPNFNRRHEVFLRIQSLPPYN